LAQLPGRRKYIPAGQNTLITRPKRGARRTKIASCVEIVWYRRLISKNPCIIFKLMAHNGPRLHPWLSRPGCEHVR
jgi:hypothetical protein